MKKSLLQIIVLLLSPQLWALEYLNTRPMLMYGDFRVFDRVINTTVSRDQNSLELDNYSSEKIQVTSTKKIYLSAGAIATGSQQISGNIYGWTTLGLFPQVDSFAKYYKEFKDIQSYEKHDFDIPKSSLDLLNWEQGDAVFYNATGGVKLLLLAGYSQIGAGIQAMVQGGFSVYLEKKEQNQVYLELQRHHTKGVGALAGTYIAYAELMKLIEKNKGHIFLVDLNNLEQKNALDEFLSKGILSNLQSLNANSNALNDIGNVSIVKKSKNKKLALATPIIPLLETSRSSNMEEISIKRENDFGFREDVTILEKSLDRNNRFFKYQKDFARSVVVEKDNEQGDIEISLGWNSNSNLSNERRFNRVLNRFVKDTEQTWIHDLNLNHIEDEKLKFVELDFKLQFSAEAVKRMLAKEDLKDLVKRLSKFWIKNKFEDALKIVRTCGGKLNTVIQGQRISQIQREAIYSFDSKACEL